jgi:uncharacterized surface protein with fasciclin (FAS1) repeats
MAGQDGTNLDQTIDPGKDDKLQTHSMADTLARLKECTLFSEMVNKAGLHGALGHSGLYTLFAPENAALGKHTPSNPREFLEQHMLNGAMRSDDLQDLQTVKTVAGTTIPVRLQGKTIQVGEAAIKHADIQCTNGVIHFVSANPVNTLQ